MFQLERANVVSHVGSIWIGPWTNFPQYMDRVFALTLIEDMLL